MASYLPQNKQHYETDFLQLRQKIKESIRKKMQNGDTDIASTSEQGIRKLPYNDFGSFFGPSQTVIASRVLKESKLLLENEKSSVKNSYVPLTSGLGTKYEKDVKRKAEKLRDSRDYSLLFSDDAELPVSIKEPSSPDSLVPTSKPVSSSSKIQPKPNGQTHTREGSAIKSKQMQKFIKYKNDQRPSSRLGPQRPVVSSSDPRRRKVEQRNVSLELPRSHTVNKQPLKRADQQLKKKKKKKAATTSEDDLALQMVRQMCKTDRYVGRDFEDDKCMEANFEDIMKEEKRSEKLAKKEDAEQQRLIEEEERRERMRKQKRQKL